MFNSNHCDCNRHMIANKIWSSCKYALRCQEHHAVPQGTAVTLHPPETKSCRIIWCVVQREHIVENCCDLLGFKCFQRLLSVQFIHRKSFWSCYCAFYEDVLHILNSNTALKNKIDNWTKWQTFTWYPGVRFMSSYTPELISRLPSPPPPHPKGKETGK